MSSELTLSDLYINGVKIKDSIKYSNANQSCREKGEETSTINEEYIEWSGHDIENIETSIEFEDLIKIKHQNLNE